MKRPGLYCILKSITWERKLSVFQVTIKALASQNHGESPSFLVVSSLPIRHFSARPEPDIDDRVGNLNKLEKCDS